MNGTTADLFRAPKRNRHGDPVADDGVTPVAITDKDGNAFLGTITNVLVGSTSSNRVNDRQESSDGRGQIGFLKRGKLIDGTPAPKVSAGDRLIIDGQPFEVLSDPNWDTPHTMTSTSFSDLPGASGFKRYWVDAAYRR